MKRGAEIVWEEGQIHDCRVESLQKFSDPRGWLAEFFRHDEMPDEFHPQMGYLSLTHPGVSRGPHEHREQADLFVFFDGMFHLFLWDTRHDSPTFGRRRRLEVGRAQPVVVIIPPGVVHAYKNAGGADAYSINCPNRLYAGEGKNGPVDEIRHEDVEGSPFVMD